MPGIKVKTGGAYVDPVGIFVKRGGVYAPAAGVSAKSAGSYSRVDATLDQQIAASLPRIWLDPSDSAQRFQDMAAASPISANNQSFARLNDKSGLANHVGQSSASSMLTYMTDGSLHWARADGIDDSWKSMSPVNLGGTDKLTLILGLRKRSDAATGMVLESSPSTSANDGSFGIRAPQGALANMACVARGTGATPGSDAGRMTANTFPSPVTFVLFVQYDLSQPTTELQIVVEVNGIAVPLSTIGLAAAGAGTFANFVWNLFRRNDTNLPAAVDFFGLLGYDRILNASDKALGVRRYMSSKAGVSLA